MSDALSEQGDSSSFMGGRHPASSEESKPVSLSSSVTDAASGDDDEGVGAGDDTTTTAAPVTTNPKVPSTGTTTTAATTTNTNTTNNDNNGMGKARSGGHSLQFPWKLHEMLDLAEKIGKQDVVSWLPCGKGFRVHKKVDFCEQIMPSYFASTKYKTFQRSLNLWGFESVSKGPNRGACYHQYFLKGQPDVCHKMTRIKIKGQPTAASVAARAAHNSIQAVSGVSQIFPRSSGVGLGGGGSFPGHYSSVGTNPPTTTTSVLPGMANTNTTNTIGPGGSNNNNMNVPSVSAFIRGNTRQDLMPTQQQQTTAAAAAAAGAMVGNNPTGLGFMGGTSAVGLLGLQHQSGGFGLGMGGMVGTDPTALSSFYGAELMARRASMERHHAMALATLLTPPVPVVTVAGAGAGAEAATTPTGQLIGPSPPIINVINGVPPPLSSETTTTESTDLAKVRAADLTASATHVLQL